MFSKYQLDFEFIFNSFVSKLKEIKNENAINLKTIFELGKTFFMNENFLDQFLFYHLFISLLFRIIKFLF